MDIGQIILTQLVDPFRIALLAGLVLTMMRTRAATGILLPLAAGVVFVAAIIPSTVGATGTEPFWRVFATGIVSNMVILGIILGIWEAVRRVRGG